MYESCTSVVIQPKPCDDSVSHNSSRTTIRGLIWRSRLRPASKTLLSLCQGTDYDDFSKQYTTHVYSIIDVIIFIVCTISASTKLTVKNIYASHTRVSHTEDAPWVEPRTTIRVRNYDVSPPYRSTLLPSSQQALPSAACACHSPVPPQKYAGSGHAHRAAPDSM